MALQIGTPEAIDGLAKAIYTEVDAQLAPAMGDAAEAARDSWRKLSFAVAAGVVEHLKANLEVVGVKTGGNVSAPVAGGVATQNGVVFVQTNDGTGRVR